MVGKVSGQLEVLCIVLGTGEVTNPIALALDDVAFPPLNIGGQNVPSPGKSFPSTAQSTVTGSLKPDVIVAELWQAYTNYMELLAPEFEAETARLARQRVREEQEAAYQESLRQDQLKAKEKARAEEEERIERERLARQRDQQQTEAAQRRLAVAASLPREPPAPNTPAAKAFLARPEGAAGITSLRFRLPRNTTVTRPDPNQSTLLRRFAGLDKLQTVLDYAESQGYPVSEYKLLTTFPRRDLTTLDRNSTLADLKLVPQETLTLEQR
ncbi:FAS-associated factor 1 [Fasciola hepatica]|uniref:FAS-associated factor 1 n=1 Tax=Fasciola hepatica TaxID=6192 RepID=A0A4E0QYV7_FASHE|nr:FAS-associated factor 1 [Fasciola hepatica]